MALTISTILSLSWVSRHTGQASTPPKRLNSAALPSITGMAAAGPMLPSPSTAEPSLTTATVPPAVTTTPGHVAGAAVALAAGTAPNSRMPEDRMIVETWMMNQYEL